MFFFLILIGFFHGFVITPIILSMYNNSKKRKNTLKELSPDSAYKLVNDTSEKF